MAEHRSIATRRWIFCAGYAALLLALMLIHLVPLSVGPGRIPGPDLMLAITLAWMLRRPAFLPTPLIAVMFLLGDIFFMRPLGLHAALAVLASEFLRAREASTREQTFVAEWIMVSGLLIAIFLTERIVLSLFLVEQVALGLTLFQAIATLLVYPLIVFASRLLFGISKMSASEAEAGGRV